MHVEFVSSVFDDLLARGWLRTDHRLVAVAARGNERDLFVRLGFTDALLTNLDAGEAHDHLAPFEWQRRSADHLGLPDRSVDWAVVIDGLHHCPDQDLPEAAEHDRDGGPAAGAALALAGRGRRRPHLRRPVALLTGR